jgi:hypothetical protein
MLHQKMQKFQRRLFYAPLSSEDNAVIENFEDSVTLYFEVNSKSKLSPAVINPTHQAPCILLYFFVSSLHTEGIGNQGKRPGTVHANEPDLYLSVFNPFLGRESELS